MPPGGVVVGHQLDEQRDLCLGGRHGGYGGKGGRQGDERQDHEVVPLREVRLLVSDDRPQLVLGEQVEGAAGEHEPRPEPRQAVGQWHVVVHHGGAGTPFIKFSVLRACG